MLQKDIKIPINRIINTKNCGTIVKFANGEDAQKACDLLKQKLGEDFQVSMQEPYKPRLKILGIPNDFDKEEMESDINITLYPRPHYRPLKIYFEFRCYRSTCSF